ncbi:hypothetical protein MJO28_007879, partial [Puccinia striiformis f. sp. tritici]
RQLDSQASIDSIDGINTSTRIRRRFVQKATKALYAHNQYALLSAWMTGTDKRGVLAPNWRECAGHKGVDLGDIWNRVACWRWLADADKVAQYIFFLYHVACGQPGRGTEESVLSIYNLDSTPRNIYWRSGRFMVQSWYHKGQNMTNKSKPRQVYLTPQLSVHLHNYLAYIRPIQLAMLKYIGKEEVLADMQRFLFVGCRVGRWKTADQTRILSNIFVESGLAGLGTASWRQCSASIARAHLPGMPGVDSDVGLDEDSGVQNVVDLQRNHSSAIANKHYGFSSGSGLSREMEVLFQRASEMWQDLWGIRTPAQVYAQPDQVLEDVAPEVAARQALVIFTGKKGALFRSPHQEAWVTALFRKNVNMLVVSRTGGGKSFVYMLPPLVRPKEQIVVIQPLRALINQTIQDLKDFRVRVEEWVFGQPLSPDASVIVVMSEKAASPEFHQAASHRPPARIIIDKAHAILDDRKFRPYGEGLARLTDIATQFVFTTGSLPPSQQDDLIKGVFGLDNVQPFRECTFRPELQVDIRATSVGSVQAFVGLCCGLISAKLVKDSDRAIIFIENKSRVNEVVTALGAHVKGYHGDLEERVKGKMAVEWRKEEKSVMVATSGFGAGINYPHVRLVVIWGLPTREKASRVFQQIGRAGRDQLPAYVLLVPYSSDMNPATDDFQTTLLMTGRCPAGVFSDYEDLDVRTCANYPNKPAKCNQCTHSVPSETNPSESVHDSPSIVHERPEPDMPPPSPKKQRTNPPVEIPPVPLANRPTPSTSKYQLIDLTEDDDDIRIASPTAFRKESLPLSPASAVPARLRVSSASPAKPSMPGSGHGRDQPLPQRGTAGSGPEVVPVNATAADDTLPKASETTRLLLILAKFAPAAEANFSGRVCGWCLMGLPSAIVSHEFECDHFIGMCEHCCGKSSPSSTSPWLPLTIAEHHNPTGEHSPETCEWGPFSRFMALAPKMDHPWICTSCALPSDIHAGYHKSAPNTDVCKNGFAGVAYEVAVWAFRHHHKFLGRWTRSTGSPEEFGTWLATYDTNQGWLNVVNIFLMMYDYQAKRIVVAGSPSTPKSAGHAVQGLDSRGTTPRGTYSALSQSGGTTRPTAPLSDPFRSQSSVTYPFPMKGPLGINSAGTTGQASGQSRVDSMISLSMAGFESPTARHSTQLAHRIEQSRIQATGTPSSSTVAAQNNTADRNQCYSQLQLALSKFTAHRERHQDNPCPWCYAADYSLDSHRQKDCRRMEGLCFRCMGDHPSAECEVEYFSVLLKDTRGLGFVCYGCALPGGQNSAIPFHTDESRAGSCTNGFIGVALAVALKFYYDHLALATEMTGSEMNVFEYIKWLARPQGRGPNNWPNVLNVYLRAESATMENGIRMVT